MQPSVVVGAPVWTPAPSVVRQNGDRLSWLDPFPSKSALGCSNSADSGLLMRPWVAGKENVSDKRRWVCSHQGKRTARHGWRLFSPVPRAVRSLMSPLETHQMARPYLVFEETDNGRIAGMSQMDAHCLHESEISGTPLRVLPLAIW